MFEFERRMLEWLKGRPPEACIRKDLVSRFESLSFLKNLKNLVKPRSLQECSFQVKVSGISSTLLLLTIILSNVARCIFEKTGAYPTDASSCSLDG